MLPVISYSQGSFDISATGLLTHSDNWRGSQLTPDHHIPSSVPVYLSGSTAIAFAAFSPTPTLLAPQKVPFSLSALLFMQKLWQVFSQAPTTWESSTLAWGSRYRGSCFTQPVGRTELQRGLGGEGCRSQGEDTSAGDTEPLLCIVFYPLTILLCLNGIREATRELYCQAHHGNTSALKTYQLLGALTHCFPSSPRSSFPCCLHTPGCLAIPGGPP